MVSAKPVLVRGGGDLASGVALRLFNAGFRVIILETEKPSAIRRSVSFCEAVYDGEKTVEGVTASTEDKPNSIKVMVDPEIKILFFIQPLAIVDATLAKKNMGLKKELADTVIALGPGFEAGVDAHAVIETMRGHDLGRIIYDGKAADDTGVPGEIKGIAKERVIHAPCAGKLKIIKDIGSVVEKGEPIADIDGKTVNASISGIVRGMIRDGYQVFEGMKIADIDPRKDELKNCYTVSDKARALGGSVLEVIMSRLAK
jgi:xanthine dehydrogenase accessory factor